MSPQPSVRLTTLGFVGQPLRGKEKPSFGFVAHLDSLDPSLQLCGHCGLCPFVAFLQR